MNTDSSTEPRGRDGRCSACGRYVGPADACPFCGSPAGRLVSWTALRIGAVVLAIVGIGLLHAAALRREPPLVLARDIVPSMNYACVRIAGRVEGAVRVMRRGDTVNGISFRVDDGSGEIAVAAYDAGARDIIQRVPDLKSGAEIEATGSLSVRTPGRNTLYVETPGQIKVLAPAP